MEMVGAAPIVAGLQGWTAPSLNIVLVATSGREWSMKARATISILDIVKKIGPSLEIPWAGLDLVLRNDVLSVWTKTLAD